MRPNTPPLTVGLRHERASPSALAWSAVAAVGLALYAATASRGVGWQDFGEYVLRLYDPQVMREWGLARWHPLHYFFSRLSVAAFPAHPPFAVSLVSAVFGAVAVANVYGIIRQITRRNVPALLACAGLAVAHTFWRLSTNPECYTISTALLTGEIWALVLWTQTGQSRWLILMMFCNGLGFSNHNLALLTLPVLSAVLAAELYRHRLSLEAVLLALGAWIVGASPFLFLIARQIGISHQVADTIRSALFGNFQHQAIGTGLHWQNTAASVAFTLLSFPNFMLPATLIGIFVAKRVGVSPMVRRVLLASLIIHLVFVLRYDVPDQYTFLLPSYSIMAVFAGIAMHGIMVGWSARRAMWVLRLSVLSILLTPAFYVAAKVVAERVHVLGERARNKPARNDYQYLFLPWGCGDDSAERMSSQATALAGPNGMIVVEDRMASFAVRYQIIHLEQRNLEAVDSDATSRIEQAVRDGRKVVFVPLRTDESAPQFAGQAPEKAGDLWVFNR